MVFEVVKEEKFRRKNLVSLFVYGFGFLLCFSTASLATDKFYSYNSFGGIGLLDMRTARFSPDGTLAVGIVHQQETTRYFSTWQATPWLETTLSYANEKSDHLEIDRSLDVKIRLVSEGSYRPQLAIGVQDALGSGNYDAEYIVASKRYYDFDITMGLAWGYLGSRGGMGNMFHLFGNGFDERSTDVTDGGIRTKNFFSGKDMTFYAGVEYHPPVKGLSVKVEYSGVDRRKTAHLSQLKRKTAFNIGLNYKPVSWAEVAIGLDHGNQFGFRLTLKQNLRNLKFGRLFKDIGPAPIIERSKTRNSPKIYPTSAFDKGSDLMFDRVRRFGAKVKEIEQSPEKLILKVAIKENSDLKHLMLLGAILEYYKNVTLHISYKEREVRKYDVSRSDIIGQMAIEKFRDSAVYLREQTTSHSRPAARHKKNGAMSQALFSDMEKAGLKTESVKFREQEAIVKKETGPYFNEMKNIGRTARILTRNMPDDIEKFTIISKEDDIEISRVSVFRQDFEKANSFQSSPEEIWANGEVSAPGGAVKLLSAPETDIDEYQQEKRELFNWGVRPEAETHFGGSRSGKFRGNLYAKLFASVRATKNLKLSATLRQHIVGDFNKIPVDTRPHIPKVRSDISHYAREGRTAIERMQLDYSTQIGQDFYARATAGLLETMFGGIGAEFIYRPYRKNFAFGVDMNWAKQRDFNQLFSFRDYNILTGHLTFYHENTAYNITSKISAGRYLAGDYGATFDVSRRFSNGIRIGVWATVTNMSSDDFGEGSFDKGIYMTLPLEIFWYKPTRERGNLYFTSLGKNGGQKLNRGHGLYDLLSFGQPSRLAQDWREILD